MEELSFLFIAMGAMLAIVCRCYASGWRIGSLELCAILTLVAVAVMSWFGFFVGPVGDARRYHQTINECFGSLPPCGSKPHEILWSFFSAFAGLGWALIYGFAVATGLSLISRAAVMSWRTPTLAVLFLYSAYQIGNGMAEGTFFLLLLIGLVALHTHHFNFGAAGLSSAFIAHLGNAPFLLYLLRFPRGWPVVIVSFGSVMALIVVLGGVHVDDVYSIVNKAGALASREGAFSAIETKATVSVREASTSYADILLDMGFPYAPISMVYSIVLYLLPVLAGGSVVTLGLGVVSTMMTIATFWLARKNKIILLVVAASMVVFGLASFTPGIGLRHKVPLFLFVLMAKNSKALRYLVMKK